MAKPAHAQHRRSVRPRLVWRHSFFHAGEPPRKPGQIRCSIGLHQIWFPSGQSQRVASLPRFDQLQIGGASSFPRARTTTMSGRSRLNGPATHQHRRSRESSCSEICVLLGARNRSHRQRGATFPGPIVVAIPDTEPVALAVGATETRCPGFSSDLSAPGHQPGTGLEFPRRSSSGGVRATSLQIFVGHATFQPVRPADRGGSASPFISQGSNA